MSALSAELSALAGHWIVKESTVSCGPGPPGTLLVAFNALRWSVSFVVLGGAGAEITITPSPATDSQHGFFIGSNSQLIFYYRQNPALAQSAWFASADVVHPLQVYIVEELVQQ